MKKNLLFLFLFFVSFPGLSQYMPWATHATGASGSSANVQGKAITVSKLGTNTFVTGSYEGSITFGSNGSTNLTGSGGMYIVKYNGNGSALWANHSRGSTSVAGEAIDTDGAENSYVAGDFKGSPTFGSFTLNGGTDEKRSVFVSKFGATGSVEWARQSTGTADAHVTAIATDNDGNTYVAGVFSGGLDANGQYSASAEGHIYFGHKTIAHTTGVSAVFLVKYDANGNVVWLRDGGSSNNGLIINDLSTDGSGNVYLTGHFNGNAHFGVTTLSGGGFFVIKFSGADGLIVWAKQLTAPDASADAWGQAVAAGYSGGTYITGYFYNPITLGSWTLTPGSRGYDWFVVYILSNGTIEYARKLETTDGWGTERATVDLGGNVYKTGYFLGSANFGATTLTGDPSLPTAFVAIFDLGGSVRGAVQSSSANLAQPMAIAANAATSAFVTGAYAGPIRFGYNDLPAGATSTNENMFTVKFEGTTVPPTITTGPLPASAFCAGSAVSIPVKTSGYFITGTVFTAQLSDASGSFASPVPIGKYTTTTPISSDGHSFNMAATIPATTAPGTGYRIRVVSASPTVIGSDNGTDLTVNFVYPPSVPLGQERCGAGSLTLYADRAPEGGSYRWYTASEGGEPIAETTTASSPLALTAATPYDFSTYTTPILTATTTYYVSAVSSGGCESVRTPVTATINPLPAVTASAGATTITAGGATTLNAAGAVSYVWSPGTGLSSTTSANPTASPAATTTYTVTGTDEKGCTNTASVTVTVNPAPPSCTATGTILREQWNGVTGKLVSSIPVNTAPSSSGQLTLFEAPGRIGDSYGARLRGYLCPPQSGSYTFWVSGDDHVELWLSTDDDPASKKRIAYHTGYTAPRDWSKYASQKSAPVSLQAGRRYYVEALHKEDGGNDHVAVAWRLPDGTMEAPITGARLSPFTTTQSIQANSISSLSPEVANPLTKEEALLAYPNPSSRVITIEFSLDVADEATLQVFDINGILLQTLHKDVVEPGKRYSFEFDGSNYTSGVYMCRLLCGKSVSYKRLVLVK
jgi:hypothetical protein